MLTCEHASNRLPAAFKKAVPESVLNTHRAYDIGAAQVFRKLVKTNKSAFSEYYEQLDKATASKVKAQATAYWSEYRTVIEKFVKANAKKEIIHLGIHSFTPELNGKVRNTDIGILYDPSRPKECELAQVIKAEIKRLHPEMKVRFNYPYKGTEMKVRFNYPYKGTSDGLTTTLRKKIGPRYAGLEIEINQKFFK